MCDATALATLEKDVSSISQALQTLSDCFNYLDNTSYTHLKNDGTSYCATDPKQSPELQLAHMESHIASLESSQGTYCCSAEECKDNCPGTGSTSNTCDPDCKPHAPAFINTLEVKPRIQNIANRLRSIAPYITSSGTPPSCTPSKNGSSTSQTTNPSSGQTGQQPIEVTGLDDGTTPAPVKKSYVRKYVRKALK